MQSLCNPTTILKPYLVTSMIWDPVLSIEKIQHLCTQLRDQQNFATKSKSLCKYGFELDRKNAFCFFNNPGYDIRCMCRLCYPHYVLVEQRNNGLVIRQSRLCAVYVKVSCFTHRLALAKDWTALVWLTFTLVCHCTALPAVSDSHTKYQSSYLEILLKGHLTCSNLYFAIKRRIIYVKCLLRIKLAFPHH